MVKVANQTALLEYRKNFSYVHDESFMTGLSLNVYRQKSKCLLEIIKFYRHCKVRGALIYTQLLKEMFCGVCLQDDTTKIARMIKHAKGLLPKRHTW